LEDLIRRDGPRGERGAGDGTAGEGGVTPPTPPVFPERDGVTLASPPGVTDESRSGVTPASPNIESDQEEPDHQEAKAETLSRHIPSELLSVPDVSASCDSDLSVLYDPSSTVEVGFKGYVYNLDRDDMPAKANQPISGAGEGSDQEVGILAEADLWQAAQVRLRLSLSADDFNSVVRYAALLAYDPTAGRAVVALPNAFLCKQVDTRLAFPIATALSQISGSPVQVQAIVQPVGRRTTKLHPPVLRQAPRAPLRRPAPGQRSIPGRSS
jgi:hypothetical protein